MNLQLDKLEYDQTEVDERKRQTKNGEARLRRKAKALGIRATKVWGSWFLSDTSERRIVNGTEFTLREAQQFLDEIEARIDIGDEELENISAVEVNKRFS